VGFPGETSTDFEETCRVVREAGFSRIHVFSYSPRSGTPAASFADRVPPETVHERRQRMRELEKELARTYHRSLLGRRLEVLVEGADPDRPGHVLGTSCRYAPVSFPAHAAALVGKLVPVRVERLERDTLVGHPEPDDRSLEGLHTEHAATS